MTIYQTVVCDRCGTEQKKEHSNSWLGWHENAGIQCDGVTRLYSGKPDFTWQGTLCSGCAGEVDEGVRALLVRRPEPRDLSTKGYRDILANLGLQPEEMEEEP